MASISNKNFQNRNLIQNIPVKPGVKTPTGKLCMKHYDSMADVNFALEKNELKVGDTFDFGDGRVAEVTRVNFMGDPNSTWAASFSYKVRK